MRWWHVALAGVIVLAALAGVARTLQLGWHAAVASEQEHAWSCGYATARCEWNAGPDAPAFCAQVPDTCKGLEWIGR